MNKYKSLTQQYMALLKNWDLIFAIATVCVSKCFIQYWPDDYTLGAKHVSVKVTTIKLCWWFLINN
jgi:hypothetical protein